MVELVRVIIPVYKGLSYYETVSLRQCFSVLFNHPVTLICPPHLNIDDYLTVAKDCSKELAVERFNAEFFDGIDGYNKLMMSLDLYERFKNSTYLLIYQTDAFVFKDDLQYWCDRNYDYIGAPWPFDVTGWLDAGYPREVIRYHKIFGRKKVSSVGNGGLSLRKTSSFINNLRFFKPFMKRWKFNEDMFFSHYVNAMNPFFKIPKIKIARRFAFDVNPAEFLELNDHELPFGCHGWYRDDSDYEGNLLFWKKFIEAYGYSLP